MRGILFFWRLTGTEEILWGQTVGWEKLAALWRLEYIDRQLTADRAQVSTRSRSSPGGGRKTQEREARHTYPAGSFVFALDARAPRTGIKVGLNFLSVCR